jgi:RND family efflux transporter MFP subunit
MAQATGFKWWIPGVAILAVAFVGAAWFFVQSDRAKGQADPEKARKKDRPIPVRTVQVSESPIEEIISGTCLTNASYTATVQIGASRGFNWVVSDIKLKAVHCWSGMPVRKGQLLFEVDDTSFIEVVRQSEKELDYAKSDLDYVKEAIPNKQKIRELELESAIAELKYRKEDFAGRKAEFHAILKLHETKTATDFQYYDIVAKYTKAKFDLEVSEKLVERTRYAQTVGLLADQADLDKAKEKYEKDRVNLFLARHDLERGLIRSPLDGYVTMVTVVPGAEVQVGQVLTQVVQLDPMFVSMDFPQERIDDLAIGQRAEVVLDSSPKETFYGKVIRILPQVNPQLRVLPVIIELKNPNSRIKADVSGHVRLYVTKKALTIPATAVIQQGSQAIAFRVEDGRARLREVRTGNLTRVGDLEVRDGLSKGDEVVIFNQYYLKDNDRVDVDWRKWARRD